MRVGSTNLNGNRLFPVFLKLDNIETLVVGGGNVGLEKISALLKNDPEARITVVAPRIKEEIHRLAQRFPGILIVERVFIQEDLDGVDLVILATADRSINAEIRKMSRSKGILTNVADTPDLCDFYLGSTVKKGHLKLGISTNGKSPTMSKRLRELFEEVLPEELDELIDNLKIYRDSMSGDFAEKVKQLNELTENLIVRNEEII